jgi:hypothetical protein
LGSPGNGRKGGDGRGEKEEAEVITMVCPKTGEKEVINGT